MLIPVHTPVPFIVYIIVTVPVVWEVTIPLIESTDATEGFDEVQTPPVGFDVRLIVFPKHKFWLFWIIFAFGTACSVTVTVAVAAVVQGLVAATV